MHCTIAFRVRGLEEENCLPLVEKIEVGCLLGGLVGIDMKKDGWCDIFGSVTIPSSYEI